MPRTAVLLTMLVALGPWDPCFAQSFGTLTILEGEALVLRGSGRLHAIEGLRLAAADIVEIGDSGFAQIELGDKSRLLLGPKARLLLNASAPKQKAELSAYLLGGWVKLIGSSREPQSNTAALELRSPRFDIPAARADIVVQINAEQADVFVESGAVRIVERGPSANAQPLELKQGQHYSRRNTEKALLQVGPQRAFVAALPRAFRDPLPSRIAQFAGKEIAAKPAPDFTYADVEEWLKADPAVRRPLVTRWRHKSRDAAFRGGLIANMAAHTEWDRILFPEKYLPKPPPPPAAMYERQATNPSIQYRQSGESR